jgi:uncharacterized damage-inducible protein DinB
VTTFDIVSVERHSKETVFMPTQSQTENAPIVKSAQDLYEIVKGDVIAAAEIMPESGYSLKIDPDVRSFGQQVAHIADAIYLFASSCMGEPNPFPGVTPVEAGVLEKTKATKSDIVNVLKSSFAYCDRAFTSASDTALVETVEFPASRNKIVNKAFLLNLAFFHTAEHYGAMTLYLRSQGIVPPSTRRFSRP